MRHTFLWLSWPLLPVLGGCDGDPVDHLALVPLEDLSLQRNTLRPASAVVEIALAEPGGTVDGDLAVHIEADDPALVRPRRVPCAALPCTVGLAPAEDRTATTEVTVTLEAADLTLSTSFSLALVPRLVTTDGDALPPVAGSLRAVLAEAEPGDVIAFGPALALTPRLPLVDTLRVDRTVRIEGPGADDLALTGDGGFGLVEVASSARLGLAGLTLTGGHAEHGGAIRASGGSVTVEDCTFVDNVASEEGGAIWVTANDAQEDSTLTVQRSTFSRNEAERGGALLAATGGLMDIDGSTFTANRAAYAGAVLLGSEGLPARIAGSTFTANEAVAFGALAAIGGPGIEVSDSTFSGHTLSGDAVLALENPVLRDVSVVDNQVGARTLYVAGGAAELVRVEVARNVAARLAAGIASDATNLVLTDSVIRENRLTDEDGVGAGLYVGQGAGIARTEIAANGPASEGGGIYAAEGTAAVSLDGVLLRDNLAEGGGGIYVAAGASASLTGGTEVLHNEAGTGGGMVVQLGAVVAVDDARFGAPGDGNVASNGGGIFTIGALTLTGATVVEGNQANTGGGLFLARPASSPTPRLDLGGAQVLGNHADTSGGGVRWSLGAVLVADGAVIAGNTVGTRDGGAGLLWTPDHDVAFPCPFPDLQLFENTDSTGGPDDLEPPAFLCNQ